MTGLPAGSVVDLFCELAAISSPPGRERPVADAVAAYLHALGLEVAEDDTGPELGSDCGNLYCRVPASSEAGMPLVFCAHMDTVASDVPVRPLIEGGMIRNAEPGILGADNKAAVAAMLQAVRDVVRGGLPHAGIELVITTQEEVGLRGAKAFDVSQLHARHGYVFDHAGAIGGIVMRAPSQFTIYAEFTGRPAHAGIAPEQGRSAIAAAARAIAEMRLGRLDEQTTASVGVIAGGSARNVVPEHCSIEAEARSLDHEKARRTTQLMVDAIQHGASIEECGVETRIVPEYEAYRLRRSDPVVTLATRALEARGHSVELLATGGGADAHIFNARGIECANLPNGMAQIHTADEHIAVADVEEMVRVALALIDGARH